MCLLLTNFQTLYIIMSNNKALVLLVVSSFLRPIIMKALLICISFAVGKRLLDTLGM